MSLYDFLAPVGTQSFKVLLSELELLLELEPQATKSDPATSNPALPSSTFCHFFFYFSSKKINLLIHYSIVFIFCQVICYKKIIFLQSLAKMLEVLCLNAIILP